MKLRIPIPATWMNNRGVDWLDLLSSLSIEHSPTYYDKRVSLHNERHETRMFIKAPQQPSFILDYLKASTELAAWDPHTSGLDWKWKRKEIFLSLAFDLFEHQNVSPDDYPLISFVCCITQHSRAALGNILGRRQIYFFSLDSHGICFTFAKARLAAASTCALPANFCLRT